MRRLAILLALAAAPCVAQQTPADSTRVYELAEVEVLPRPQNVDDFRAALRQAYPPHLYQAGVGGTVEVSFVVGADGAPADVRVVSTADSSFNAPSVQAVSLLRFTPAQVQGSPVAVRVAQPITWRVDPAVASAPPIPDSIHVYAVDEADVRPMPQSLRAFREALRDLYPAGLEGESASVRVRFAIDPGGRPRYPHVLESSDARFDAVSMEAVGRLTFNPAQRGGEPVWVWMEVPVEWEPDSPVAAGDGQNGYELSAVEELPRLLNRDAFGRELARLYPVPLRDAGTQGTVQVRFRIEVNGSTSNQTITHTTDHAFDQPTLEAVRVLRFEPARLNGRAVPVWVEQPIMWTIGGRAAGVPEQSPVRHPGTLFPRPRECGTYTQC